MYQLHEKILAGIEASKDNKAVVVTTPKTFVYTGAFRDDHLLANWPKRTVSLEKRRMCAFWSSHVFILCNMMLM